MRFVFLISVLAFTFMQPQQGVAQDKQTLADIRQELSVLFVEVQRLKRELSTTGTPNVDVSSGSALNRINAIEAELQRLTSTTEQLEFRINQVVSDGTNRIGDLEFRLVELEGGDVGQLGETTTLGGGEAPLVVPSAPATTPSVPLAELAMGEQSDFDKASKALAAGEFQSAADQFSTFSRTYPGGPLAADAALKRGAALEGLGKTREAARAYLEGFSGNPTGPQAPKALYLLGTALGALEQKSEACVTLSEVGIRFPDSGSAQDAQAQMRTLGCP